MSGIWSGDTRCVVMLGFDVDGVSSALNSNPDTAKLPSFMSMREYGPSVAAPRILDVLDKHEVGHHGYMHEAPATLSPEKELEVLDHGSGILERITGQKVLGYRSPSWELSEYSIQYLIDRGFVYDSSLMGDDIPYIVTEGDSQLVEIPVHWEWDDHPYFSFAPALGGRSAMASPEQVYQAWSAGFEGAYHYGRAFVLTMHPHIIGRPGRLRMLERLIAYMKSMPGVEFRRAIDVAAEWKA